MTSSSPFRFVLASCLLSTCAWAQPVPSRDPGTTHIFPAGAKRGTKLKVRVGTECFPPGARLRFFGEGIQATKILEQPAQANYEPSPRRRPTIIPISHPREWQAEVDVAADAPLGPRLWRLSCAQGGSRQRVFVVGGLPEFIERESNSLPERAERLETPVTVNGQIAGERDLDYFVFSAQKGQIVVCEVLAARLGSPLEPVVQLRRADGRCLNTQRIHVGVDPVIAFRAPESGDYRLMVSHVAMHGGPDFVYRINLSTDPYLYSAFPAGGRAGVTRRIEWQALSGEDSPRTLAEQVVFPAKPERTLWHRSSLSPARVFPLAVSKFNEVTESRENNARDGARRLPPGTIVNGRFEQHGDVDWYRIQAEKSSRWTLECRRPARSEARPVLALLDPAGKLVRQANGFEREDGSCRIEWTSSAAGDYFLRVRDVRGEASGGPGHTYRLLAAPLQQGFRLRLAADSLNVPPGGKSSVKLHVERLGGFAGPIDLEIDGLPAGVQTEKTRVAAKQSEFSLTFLAAEDARCQDAELRVVGRAQLDGREIRETALARHAGCDAEGVSVASGDTGRLCLTVRHKPLFRLHCLEAYQYAHRGAVYPYQMTVERLKDHAGDVYRGDVVLQIGDRQNRDLDGIQMFPITVRPDAPHPSMPIYLPETMHINVQSQSQLYVQAYTRFTDRHGQPQSLLVVSEKRNLIRTLPTLVKLTAPPRPPAAQPGAIVRFELRLERANYQQAMELHLRNPPQGVNTDQWLIPAGQTSVRVELHLPKNIRPRQDGRLPLHFRATGPLTNHLRVITEATFTLTLAR